MGKIPKVTHTGEIDLGGFILHVYQLDNGQRVIDAEDMEKFFSSDFKITPEKADELAKLIRGNNPQLSEKGKVDEKQ